jgi:uncharacterized protein (TIGR03000 family)
MYTVVLAALLGSADAAPGADIYQEIRDVKRAVEDVKKEQSEARIDELKLIIAGLRARLVDVKLDEIRRDVLRLEFENPNPAHAAYWPAPGMPAVGYSSQTATIHSQLPAGATLTANDQPITLPAGPLSFVTPALEPGRAYYYDFKVTVTEDGKTVTRTKRITVRPGEVSRLIYSEMESR